MEDIIKLYIQDFTLLEPLLILSSIISFKDDQLITEENSRIKVVSEKAEQGFYELVVPHVQPQDAGKYSCSVMNKYGEDKCEANVKVVGKSCE